MPFVCVKPWDQNALTRFMSIREKTHNPTWHSCFSPKQELAHTNQQVPPPPTTGPLKNTPARPTTMGETHTSSMERFDTIMTIQPSMLFQVKQKQESRKARPGVPNRES